MKSSDPTQKFPLVGVGASAGGLDSFQRFLSAIPENSGMAYILVQHLSPSHESVLPEILARSTDLPVAEITNGCDLLPDHVYVIPENRSLEVTDHSLKLMPREEGTKHMPIDIFFSSLGRVHGKCAVGVVLSGTAHDGTVGLGDIKEHGGITFAEDPGSAAWDGMPKSAIEAGAVDFVLRPEEMPAKLVQVFSSYGTEDVPDGDGDMEMDGDGLKKIFSLVRQKSGTDFNYYKKRTMLRRIHRRMAIHQIEGYKDYLDFLKNDRAEQEALFQDLLIKVTSFFRDGKIYDELENDIFPKLLRDRPEDPPLRIWVAGCATGEEVYSLAICLFEAIRIMGSGERNGTEIQIFASDISETAIKKARTGVYRSSELKPLSEGRLDRYFSRIDGSYKIVKSVRDTIIFSVHNFLKDPPFRNIDLVSCRNVFIYLEPFLQEKALSTFHYALRENGYLLLGKSEGIGRATNRFAPVAKNSKLYSRKAGTGRFIPDATLPEQRTVDLVEKKVPGTYAPGTDFRKSAEKVLVSGYTPVSVIIDRHSEIVHINGNIEPFVAPSRGRPSHELIRTARKELAFELRNALHKAKESQGKVRKEGIPVKTEWEAFSVDLEVVPLTDLVDPYYLVLFWRRSAERTFFKKVWQKLGPVLVTSQESREQQRNTSLENELEQLREDMRGISEDQEAYNEELQSANEELLSGNEEMQSLNEELETSKEELESTNEELIVVNRELIEKQGELSEALTYSDDVIATIGEPFLVLADDLHIQKANASYYQKFDGETGEVEGKHFFEIHNGLWHDEGLRSLLQKVLPEERQIVDEELAIETDTYGKRIFRFNAREIERDRKSGKLILLEISDITRRKDVEEVYLTTIDELNRTNEQLDQFVHAASHDLQEPLRKIMTFASRITQKGKGISDRDLETYLSKITGSSARMSALIKSMLEFARLAHHEQLFEPTDLGTVLKDTLSDFEVLVEQKGAEMRIGELPTLEAVPLQINQLFYNLVSKALKFSKEGVPPIISISSRKLSAGESKEHASLDQDLSYHEIVVRDNGIGFGEKYSQRIFAIFHRLNPSSRYLGTGIGLALCKRIAGNHHGEIYAESTEGEGAAFHILLPVAQPNGT